MTAHGWGERFCRLLGVRRGEAGAALAGFAFIAKGASVGGLLVGLLQPAGLMVLAALLLGLTLLASDI